MPEANAYFASPEFATAVQDQLEADHEVEFAAGKVGAFNFAALVAKVDKFMPVVSSTLTNLGPIIGLAPYGSEAVAIAVQLIKVISATDAALNPTVAPTA